MAHVMNGMRKGNGRGKICGNDMGQNQRNKIMSKKYKKNNQITNVYAM